MKKLLSISLGIFVILAIVLVLKKGLLTGSHSEPTQTVQSDPINTSSWLSYTDKNSGITFKYPENFNQTVTMENGTVLFFDNEKDKEDCQKSIRNSETNSACFKARLNFNGASVSEGNSTVYQNPNEFTDENGRIWQTDMVLVNGYNYQANTVVDGKNYSVAFQSAIKPDHMVEEEFRQQTIELFDTILSTVTFPRL